MNYFTKISGKTQKLNIFYSKVRLYRMWFDPHRSVEYIMY